MPTLNFLSPQISDEFFALEERLDVIHSADSDSLLRDSMRIANAFAERATDPNEICIINTGVLAKPFSQKLDRLIHQHGMKISGFSLTFDEIPKLSEPLYKSLERCGAKVVIINSFEFAASTRNNRMKFVKLLIHLCDRLGMRVIVLTQSSEPDGAREAGALKRLTDIATSTIPISEVLGQIKEDRKLAREEKAVAHEEKAVALAESEAQETDTLLEEEFDRSALEAEGLTKHAIDRIEHLWQQQQSPYGDCSVLVPVFS